MKQIFHAHFPSKRLYSIICLELYLFHGLYMNHVAKYFLPVTLLACGGTSTTDSDSSCVGPVAEAGTDISQSLGQAVTLNGNQSTWCSSNAEDVSFIWEFSSVPSESSVNDSVLTDNQSPTASSPSFVPDVVGEYVLSLRLDDNGVSSAEDFVIVSVEAGNLVPTADCGGEYSAEVGSMVTLNGSGSLDPEVQVLTYDWSLSGPSCSSLTSASIYNGSNVQPSFVPDCDGVFIVSLIVNDGSQWSDPAICSVNVASTNRTPIADAGESQDLGGCAASSISLNGYGSYDLDGDPLTYQWSVLSVPTGSTATDASFSSTSSAVPEFTWDIPGMYTLQLQVFDGRQWSAPDVVMINIGDVAQNNRPIANAGDNQVVNVSANCESTTSYSVGSCSDCPETSFELSAAESLDPNGDTMYYSWSETTGTLDAIGGTLVSSSAAVTEVIVPAQAASLNSNTTYSFEFDLLVQDCENSDDDSVSVTYTCSGN